MPPTSRSVRRALEDQDALLIRQALEFAHLNLVDFREFLVANGGRIGSANLAHVRASLLRAERIEVVGDYEG